VSSFCGNRREAPATPASGRRGAAHLSLSPFKDKGVAARR